MHNYSYYIAEIIGESRNRTWYDAQVFVLSNKFQLCIIDLKFIEFTIFNLYLELNTKVFAFFYCLLINCSSTPR